MNFLKNVSPPDTYEGRPTASGGVLPAHKCASYAWKKALTRKEEQKMSVSFFVPSDVFATNLMKLFNVKQRSCLMLKWVRGENLHAKEYNLELSEVVIETVSSNGTPFRKWILRDNIGRYVSNPIAGLIPLSPDEFIDGIWAIKGKIDARGFPTSRELFFATDTWLPS